MKSCCLGIVVLLASTAGARAAPPEPGEPSEAQDRENIAMQLTNPIADLATVP
jgi:hypothetical protein